MDRGGKGSFQKRLVHAREVVARFTYYGNRQCYLRTALRVTVLMRQMRNSATENACVWQKSALITFVPYVVLALLLGAVCYS